MVETLVIGLGWGVLATGGMLLTGALLAIAIVSLNYVGQKFFDKLRALYDLQTLRKHMRDLERQGRTLRKSEE